MLQGYSYSIPNRRTVRDQAKNMFPVTFAHSNLIKILSEAIRGIRPDKLEADFAALQKPLSVWVPAPLIALLPA